MNIEYLSNYVRIYSADFDAVQFTLRNGVTINETWLGDSYSMPTSKSEKVDVISRLFHEVLVSLKNHVKPYETAEASVLREAPIRSGKNVHRYFTHAESWDEQEHRSSVVVSPKKVVSSRIEMENSTRKESPIRKVLDMVEKIFDIKYATSDNTYEYSCVGQEAKLHNIRAILGIEDPVPTSGHVAKMNNMRKEGRMCDFTFHIGRKTFACHKMILAAHSKVFEAMFSQNFVEGQKSASGENAFPGYSAEQFEELLNYIYTGIADLKKLTAEDILGLASLAREVQVDDLFDLCVKRIMLCHVDVENCVSIANFADLHELKDLLAVCEKFAKKNAAALLLRFNNGRGLDRTEVISFASAVSIIPHVEKRKNLFDAICKRLIETLTQDNFKDSCTEMGAMRDGPVRDVCFSALKAFAMTNKEWLEQESQSDVKASYQKALTGL